MAETLTSLIDRVEVLLADSNNKSWSTTTITECMRYALNEINLAAGKTSTSAYTINGLDTATETTIPGTDVECLIVGTAFYCAKNRAVDRLEKANLGEGPTTGLDKWANWAESRFTVLLNQVKARALQGSSSAPHSEVDWDESEHTW